LTRAFNLFNKYRPNETFAWNFYLMGMLNCKQVGNPVLLGLADSALRMFPNDKDLLVRRNEIITNMPANALNAKVIQGNDVIRSNQLFKEGTDLFTKGDFAGAAEKFISSSKISNGTYGVYENIAICYFNLKQWNQSLPYFDRVLAMKTATDGKTEYFKAAALINMGRKDEACALLQISKSKGYTAADGLINGYCK
jgi:tetratricopeptide (TPR) repeat protein